MELGVGVGVGVAAAAAAASEAEAVARMLSCAQRGGEKLSTGVKRPTALPPGGTKGAGNRASCQLRQTQSGSMLLPRLFPLTTPHQLAAFVHRPAGLPLAHLFFPQSPGRTSLASLLPH